MSPEQLAAAKADEISPEEKQRRARFGERYGSLRTKNKDLAEKQHQLRLKRKSSKGRINKSRHTALEITVILNLMLQMRGKDTVRTVQMFCRDRLCNQHRDKLIGVKRVFIHAIRKEDRDRAQFLRTSLIKELELDEFLN